MRIAICIKQVPLTSEGRMDENRGTLLRDGLSKIMNPYDAAALEAALRIKNQSGGTADVFTMGPESAEQVLTDAFSVGVDSGYLVSDGCFSGADVFATSYTLAQALTAVGGYDIIVCGAKTTDGSTGQTGASIAAQLNMPYVGRVDEIEGQDEKSIRVWQSIGQTRSLVSVSFPCVLSVERDNFVLRMPTLKQRLSASQKKAQRIRLSDLRDNDARSYGQSGSFTRVERIVSVQRKALHPIVYTNAATAADMILSAVEVKQ